MARKNQSEAPRKGGKWLKALEVPHRTSEGGKTHCPLWASAQEQLGFDSPPPAALLRAAAFGFVCALI